MNRRYEREIRELLEKMGGQIPRESKWQRWRRRVVLWALGLWVRLVQIRLESPSRQLVLSSFGLALLVFLLGSVLGPLGRLLALMAPALFAAGYISAFVERRGPRYAPRWRGQIIDYRRPRRYFWDDLLDRFRRRW